MIYLIYLLLVPINLVGTILTFPLAFFLPLFATGQYGWINNATAKATEPRLPAWLNWFQTWDNSLWGDNGFKSNHGTSWFSQVQWLWRNPFYGFEIKTFDGSTGMNYVGDIATSETHYGHILVTGHGLFQFVYTHKLGFKTFYLNLGWNIRALVDPAFITPDQWHDNTEAIKDWHATFAFSPRIV